MPISDESPLARRPAFDPEPEPDEEPRYALPAVAERVGVQIQTIRRYEAFGLVETRTTTTRLYSDADVERIRRIRRLTDDLGINLAGVAAVLQLRQQLVDLQREVAAMRRERGAR